MPAQQSTILIPDISGYTAFVSRTELDHSSHILNHLLETIVGSIGEDFVVSEIEGDAVLLYRKGAPPSKRELVRQCSRTFAAFHREIEGMMAHSICHCGACQGVSELTLKFVAHFGTIAEIRVGRFLKASGLDMVIAHRLLKNSIESHEYLLLSRGYLDQVTDRNESGDLEWYSAHEEYASIGVIEFDYAHLDAMRSAPHVTTRAPDAASETRAEIGIEMRAGFREVLAVLTDPNTRTDYVPGAKRVDGAPPLPAVGAKHTCVFDDFEIEVEQAGVVVSDRGAEYSEVVRIAAQGIAFAVRYVLLEVGVKRCRCDVLLTPAPGHELTKPILAFLVQTFEGVLQGLKQHLEAAH